MHYKRLQDPVLKKLKRSYNCAKNQALYRGQAWHLEFEDYANIWLENDAYLNKGRGKQNCHLSRKDINGAWHKDNVQITRRGEHLRQRMLEHYAR